MVEKTIDVGAVKLHCRVDGSGPLVVLLHGFPEFSWAWRHQIPALAKRYTVVAPDLRGYGGSDKPQRVSDYRIDKLSADVRGLIAAMGANKAHAIVGHDWGGALAWDFAMRFPDAYEKLAVLNMPHPAKMARGIRRPAQLRRSWYIFFFQLPWLPERRLTANGAAIAAPMFRGWSIRKDTFSDDDLATLKANILRPGAARAMINWYRAALRYPRAGARAKIAAPTLLIWAEKDRALGKELTYGMERFFTGPFRIHYVPDCSHWVNEEQPELVNRLLLEHLG